MVTLDCPTGVPVLWGPLPVPVPPMPFAPQAVSHRVSRTSIMSTGSMERKARFRLAAGKTSPKKPGSSKAYNMPVPLPTRLDRMAEAALVLMVTVSDVAEAEAKEQVDSAGKLEHAKVGA